MRTHQCAVFELAIAHAVEEIQKEKSITREEMAAALEMPELEVTAFELGERRLSAGGLLVLLDLFRLSWQDFEKRLKKHIDRARSEIK